jgi:diphthamide synthase (EF-2-diphthine--ammonia ligase)
MTYALFWSGGKDSLLALDRARRTGLVVTHLVNIYEGNTGRVRFHGVRKELLEAQARALGLELISEATHPRNFEAAFQSALQELKRQDIKGICFGNIHLSDIREWYENLNPLPLGGPQSLRHLCLKHHQRFLRALVALKKLGREPPLTVLRYSELDLANARHQRAAVMA